MRLMRVHSYRKPYLRPERIESHRLLGLLRVPGFENDQRSLEPRIPGAADDVVEILREGVVREVAMTVDHDRLE
jgi:hypothetical protein